MLHDGLHLQQATALRGDLHVLLARYLTQICKPRMQQRPARLPTSPTQLQ